MEINPNRTYNIDGKHLQMLIDTIKELKRKIKMPMTQEKINIAALLKDCPEGTKLYSCLFGECKFGGITDLGNISTFYGDNYEDGWDYGEYDDYGHVIEDIEHSGECLLFPSKGVRDWGCFRVKYIKGVAGKGKEIKILLESNGGIDDGKLDYGEKDYIYYIDRVDNYIKIFANYASNDAYNYILSTGTELKLEEKEEPKFEDECRYYNCVGCIGCICSECLFLMNKLQN